MEQGVERVDRVDDVAGVGTVRAEPLADRRGDGLIAEASEAEPGRPAARPGAEGAGHWLRTVVQYFIYVTGAGGESLEPRVVRVDALTGQCLGVVAFLSRYLQTKSRAAGPGRAGPAFGR